MAIMHFGQLGDVRRSATQDGLFAMEPTGGLAVVATVSG